MKGRMVRVAACGAVALAALVSAGPASAALNVSGSGDAAGGCTLRGTIEAVDAGTAGGCGTLESPTTEIDVPSGHYTLTAGQLTVATGANLAIVGAGSAQTVIDGGGRSRVLEVAAGGQARLFGLELTGGATLHGEDSTAPAGFGGRGEDGGGILNKGTLTLEGVVVTENHTGRGGNGGGGSLGTTQRTQRGGNGSAGGNGGGIFNEFGATLTLLDSTVTKNRTGDGGAGGNGGDGVSGEGPELSDEGGPGGVGGTPGAGGGIYSVGTLTIVGSTVAENATGNGGPGGDGADGAEGTRPGARGGWGGIGGSGGDPTVEYSPETGFPRYGVITGGGGIYSGGLLEVTASTIAANHTGDGGNGGGAGIGGEQGGGGPRAGHGFGGSAGSGGLGGGLLNKGEKARLVNVTIAGNFTGDGGRGGPGAQGVSLGGGTGGFGGYGGGIWSIGGGNNGFEPVELIDSTITGNLVGELGLGGEDDEFEGTDGRRGLGAGVVTGGAALAHAAGVEEVDSIIAGNGVEARGDKDCFENPGGTGEIRELAGKSVGDQDASCPGTHTDPHLGVLADNGGPTETVMPGAGSPAIGIVPLAACTVNVDQRGLSRPGSGKSACDAGAVETGGAPGGPTATTTSLSSSANPSTPGAPVTFTATVSPSPGGGTVDFTDGGSAIAGCSAKPIIAGQASCTETFASAGTHSIIANFSGTASFVASTSPALAQTVQAAGGAGGEPPGGGTGGGSETQPGGSTVSAASSAPQAGVTNPPTPIPKATPKPKPKAINCRKGFSKQKVHGKAKCVKVKKHSKHHG
jgi:Bacterial Ig-like domain (group 3)